MPFDTLINRLIPEGSVMAGRKPRTVTESGDIVDNYDTSTMGSINRAMQAYIVEAQIKKEKQQKKVKDQSDMYKTLRDAGYEPKKAYEAVMKGEFPDEASTGESKVDLETVKIKAQTEQVQAQTEKIKKTTEVITRPSAKLREEIIQKIANDEALTVGEQKIYDEVIRKYGEKSDLETVLRGKKEAADVAAAGTSGKDEFVPMLDPLGRKKLVPKGNVDKAQKKGWKLRKAQ